MISITTNELLVQFAAPINWLRVIKARFVSDHCAYCNVDLTSKNKSRDHVIPQHILRKVAEEQRRSINQINTVPCCIKCNCWKNELPLQEWAFLEDAPVHAKEFIQEQINISL